MITAHKYPEIYQDLGYNLSRLGCLMMDLEPLSLELPEDMLYYTNHPDRHWIKGLVAGTPHVTLRYGFLESAQRYRKHIETLIVDLPLPAVTIDRVGIFESPYPEERYSCIVGHLEITPVLQEIHDRLGFLPHINTFPGEYKAHVTLAYVKEDRRVDAVAAAATKLNGKKLLTTGLNYGKP